MHQPAFALLLGALSLTAIATPAAAQTEGGRPNPGALTPQQRMERALEALDADHDTRISRQELRAAQARQIGQVDTDGDGVITVDEFRERGNVLLRTMGLTLFDLLDTNGDQHLTAEELAAPVDRWLRRYDRNGDGALAAEEMPVVPAVQNRVGQQQRAGQPRGPQPTPPR